MTFRRLVPADLDDLAALYADAKLRRHFPEGTLTREETREEFAWFRLACHGRYQDSFCFGGAWLILFRSPAPALLTLSSHVTVWP